MSIIAGNIMLEEAIRRSKSMPQTSYLWLVEENVLDVDISKEYVFGSIGVLWGSHNSAFTGALNFSSNNDEKFFTVGLNHDNGQFASLEKLREDLPKLFKVTGEFSAFNLEIT